MRASMLVALSAFSLALSSAAFADDTAKPANAGGPPPAKGVITVEVVRIKGRVQRPQVVVDINRLVPRAPLPDLRKPLADRIGAAVEKDPF